ncbi:hypothetical protein SAMN05444141_106384 [Pseudovibrio denitrificans]|uniref:Uncharacterized protein n=1 Tax=Pseudovibrio denitrificans TaxID=258256 RepID=A0A1I7CSY3_9HYPH|nr:hypothetical protein SAMN05444141_106384 [Pseudovibrio denitrificans]
MQLGQSTFAPTQGECAAPVVCLASMETDGSYARTPTVRTLSAAVIPFEVLEGSTTAGVLHCFSIGKRLLDAGGHLNCPREGGYG